MVLTMRKLRQYASALEETPRRKLLSTLQTRGVLPETLGLRLPGVRPRTRIGGVVKAAGGWRREGSRQKEGGPEPSRPREPSGSLGGGRGALTSWGAAGAGPTPPHPGPGGERRGRGGEGREGEGAARALMTVDSALRSGPGRAARATDSYWGAFPPRRRRVRLGGAVRGGAGRCGAGPGSACPGSEGLLERLEPRGLLSWRAGR